MPAAANAGLVVTSHDSSQTTVAGFDSVSVTP
jgi:hypothetical protein